ncbi:MAG: hypothetical protein B6D46_04795 [Polyangiaceae bacterium UTPRO1]|nr:beta-propeller fold lactonase family protein [Myxococcales bacterium]OQY67996.1 MAG: hypothetical protein B6D46_04795 [Polyangiaceae bacterium UTPRO1]
MNHRKISTTASVRSRSRCRSAIPIAACLSFLSLTAPPAYGAHLSFVGFQQDGVAGVDGIANPCSVALSPDGAHVYVAGRGDNAIGVFIRNGTTGELTFLEQQKNGVAGVEGLAGVLSVTVSPDGKNVYAAGPFDHSIAVFGRNTATGALSFIERKIDGVGTDGLAGATWVVVSPDGVHVYAAGELDHAIAVFSRNPTTGILTFVEAQRDGVLGVDGLRRIRGIATSPDGAHVYAAGFDDDAIAVFSRNAATGALTFVEQQKDGIGGVDGLDGAIAVSVSPDGMHVYGAGRFDQAVSVFARNPVTGALTFVEQHRDGVAGVDGIGGTIHVTVSPDGNHLYTASELDHAVAVFGRNAVTGSLTFVESQTDGVNGVDGLRTAFSVAVSPDNAYLYASGVADNAVAIFRVLDVTPSTPTPHPTGSETPTGTATATPSATPVPTHTAVATTTPTATSTAGPSPTPTPSSSGTPSSTPTASPSCGDGMLAPIEQCDDGNALSADGCDSACQYEQLVPGKGPSSTDCLTEWTVVNPGNTPYLDNKGVPSFKQRCTDGDPSCDMDGTINGECRFRVAVCLHVSDANLPLCGLQPDLGRYVLRKPRPDAKRAIDAANATALLGALQRLNAATPSGKHGNELAFTPVIPASAPNVCTGPADIRVVLAGKPKAQIVMKSRAESVPAPTTVVRDSDKLVLRCQAP